MSDDDRATWQRAEDKTDRLLVPASSSLSEAQADALLTDTAAIAAGLGV